MESAAWLFQAFLAQSMGILMIGRMVVASLALISGVLISGSAAAQDVPGIEICTVEKTMERRTSCLQSNVDFLQKTITKLSLDHQQKLDAAKAQIEGLKSTVVGLAEDRRRSAVGAEKRQGAESHAACEGQRVAGKGRREMTWRAARRR